ncbi:exported hypothetical protein [Azospirillaceae bacterium]
MKYVLAAFAALFLTACNDGAKLNTSIQSTPPMTAVQITEILGGKKVTLRNVDSSSRGYGNIVTMDFGINGIVSAQSSSGISNSSIYKIIDEQGRGIIKLRWEDSRWGTDWSFTVHRVDGVVYFYAASPNSVVKWEMK